MAIIVELVFEAFLLWLPRRVLWWAVALFVLVALIALLLHDRAPMTIAAD
jgi:hypothetical protein